MAEIKITADTHCELGENPLWDPQRQCVYWTDITAGKIYCHETPTGRHRVVYEGELVGGFTLQDSGDLLLFRMNDLALLHPNGQTTALRKYSDEGMERFNDVIADPEGRVFAGTIGAHPHCGLYRVDLDGKITRLLSGTGCSNGMGFSPDCKTFYWTCSTTRRILQFDYAQATGEVTNGRLFYKTAGDVPDGLTVDAEGCVWSARWGGAAVVRHAPNGKPIERIDVPARNVTSVCLGGDKLNDLFITSARRGSADLPHAGALFHVAVAAKGRVEFNSRIIIEGSQHG
ncbi:MAG: SMP-30/gluconolactonase/LRE family protein [Pirellulales bacterium]|nr:SMP-30/gluconolactonase/LRE family protein [Pirellulales bacterium]